MSFLNIYIYLEHIYCTHCFGSYFYPSVFSKYKKHKIFQIKIDLTNVRRINDRRMEEYMHDGIYDFICI